LKSAHRPNSLEGIIGGSLREIRNRNTAPSGRPVSRYEIREKGNDFSPCILTLRLFRLGYARLGKVKVGIVLKIPD
jgi:hypothetical protein